MRRRLLSTLLMLAVTLATEVAWGQTAPIQGLDRLTPEERALAERNLERWQRLTPESGPARSRTIAAGSP